MDVTFFESNLLSLTSAAAGPTPQPTDPTISATHVQPDSYHLEGTNVQEACASLTVLLLPHFLLGVRGSCEDLKDRASSAKGNGVYLSTFDLYFTL